jgi:hypothetical protein
MVQTAFIIHGSGGNPNRHWYPWLKEKLEERGLQVFVPQFPIDEENQILENWFKTLEQFKENLENSILIGHSLGAPFILNVLNQWNCKIKVAFLVSGFVGHLEVKDEPNINDFSERKFDWDKIKSQCSKFYIIHSDNDPYVPLEKAKELAQKLGVEVILVKNGAHFQSQSGFDKFDLLLEKIENEL